MRLWNPALTVDGEDFEHIEVYAAAELTAQFSGSELADEMFIKPTHSWMESGEFVTYVRGASSVVAWANDASDRVVMYDSPANDRFMSRPESSRITGPGFDNFAVGFHEVAAHSQTGDLDEATLIGTRNNDSVRVRTTGASLKGKQHFAFARGFEQTSIDGNGGSDHAKLYDSPNDDRVELRVGSQTLNTNTTSSTLNGFTRVEVYATAGHDVVRFVGDTAAQQFTAKPTHAWMESHQQLSYARGFDVVTLNGGGGKDRSELYDSALDDQFVLRASGATVTGADFRYEVASIPHIHAFSKFGGNDSVRFVASAEADTLHANASGLWMRSSNTLQSRKIFLTCWRKPAIRVIAW